MPIPAETLLINAAYVKKYTTVNGSVDDNFIHQAITLAQDKSVEPYLGTDLMNKLKSDVSGSGTSGNYSILLFNYVQRAVCWWTVVELMHNLAYKIDNGTLVQRTSEDATPVPDSVMKDVKGRAEANARFYTQKLVDYLCDNSSLFPEYKTNTGNERSPRSDVYGQFNYSFSQGNTAMNNRYPYRKLTDTLPFTYE